MGWLSAIVNNQRIKNNDNHRHTQNHSRAAWLGKFYVTWQLDRHDDEFFKVAFGSPYWDDVYVLVEQANIGFADQIQKMVIDLATHMMIEVRKAENEPTEQDDWDWDDDRWHLHNAEIAELKKHGIYVGGVYPTESCGEIEILQIHSLEEIDVLFLDTSFEMIATIEEVLEGSLKDEFLT